ncbi:MAG: hypothetical protein P8L42_11245, partial [Flavicella sp.]|nr:hypothetical protein [Flavicella sp.]
MFTVLIVISSFTSCTTESNSKPASTKIKLYAGSKTPYQPNTIINTPVYDSLQPFYIAMVARHGSRYMSSPDEDIALKNLLQLVDKKNQLKPAGKKLLA